MVDPPDQRQNNQTDHSNGHGKDHEPAGFIVEFGIQGDQPDQSKDKRPQKCHQHVLRCMILLQKDSRTRRRVA